MQAEKTGQEAHKDREVLEALKAAAAAYVRAHPHTVLGRALRALRTLGLL